MFTQIHLLNRFGKNIIIKTKSHNFLINNIKTRKHEWEKHGTCALSLPQVQGEVNYFNFTLGLRNHFDFGPILKANGIVPSDTVLYDLHDVKKAITSVLGVEPMIVCYILKDSDVQYLSQMQICLSKEFELVDCAFEAVELVNIVVDNTPQETQCQYSLPIQYPTFQYSKLVQNALVKKNL